MIHGAWTVVCPALQEIKLRPGGKLEPVSNRDETGSVTFPKCNCQDCPLSPLCCPLQLRGVPEAQTHRLGSSEIPLWRPTLGYGETATCPASVAIVSPLSPPESWYCYGWVVSDHLPWISAASVMSPKEAIPRLKKDCSLPHEHCLCSKSPPSPDIIAL